MAELPEQAQAQLSVEHPIGIYNAFPGDFDNVQQLIQYLPTIAGMGCDVVWINPIQECRGRPDKFYDRPSKLTGEQIKVKDSLYAMTRDDRFLPGWLRDPAELTQLTTAANGLGMDMMFDLVLNHIGTDARITVDPRFSHWFNNPRPPFDDVKTFKYGYELLMMPALPSNGVPEFNKIYLEKQGDRLKYIVAHPTRRNREGKPERVEGFVDISIEGELTWEKIIKRKAEILEQTYNQGNTKYCDLQIIQQTLQQLWFPYIEKYIGTYGFSGVRLDAVRYVHPEVQKAVIEYADRCVRQLGHDKLIDINDKIAAFTKSNPGTPIPEALQKQTQLAQKWMDNGVLVFGEFLFERNPQQEMDRLIQGGLAKEYDLITNSIYYGNTTTTSYPSRYGEYQTREGTRHWQYEGAEELKRWAGGEMALKRQLTTIGTVGFTGNHDERPLALECAARLAAYRVNHKQKEKNPRADDRSLGLVKDSSAYRMRALGEEIETIFREIQAGNPNTIQQLERMMKQHIATVAFASDGGYYMLSGDEYGAPNPKNVFGARQDGPLYPDGGGLGQHWGGRHNLTRFFQEINQTLKALPIPREIYAFDICYPEDKTAHSKDVLHPQQENLRCIVRVTDNAVDVVLVNVSGRAVSLTPEHIQNIQQQMKQYNLELYHKYFEQPEKVFYHGVGIAIPPESGLQQRATSQAQVTQIPSSLIAPQLQQHPTITHAYQQRQQQSDSLVAAAEQQQRQRLTIVRPQQQPSTNPSSKPQQ